MNPPHTDKSDTSMSMSSAESDMELYEDAIGTLDEMDYEEEDTISDGSGSRRGSVAVASIPTEQFTFSNVPSNMFNVSSVALTGGSPTSRKREADNPATKRIAVETDESTRMRMQLYEQQDTYRKRLGLRLSQAQEKAKAEKEDLEHRMVERDRQWGKRLEREKAEMQKVLEDRDRIWQTLQEQAQQQERYRVEMEQKMKQTKEEDMKRMEERLKQAKVENERTLAKLMQEAKRREHSNASRQGAQLPDAGPSNNSTAPMPFAVGSSEIPATAAGPSIATSSAGPPATNPPSSSTPTNPSAQTTSGSTPKAFRPSAPTNHSAQTTSGSTPAFRSAQNPDILGHIKDLRRGHQRTNIRTRLVLDEPTSSTSGKLSQLPVLSLPEPDLEGLDDSQRATAQAVLPILPLLVNQVFQMMNESQAGPKQASPKQASPKQTGGKKANKRSQQAKEEDPEERRNFLRHIKTYLHQKLHYAENSEIEQHEPPTRDTIGYFLTGKHAGPSLDDLHMDFEGGVASDWNKRAFHLLRRGFCTDYLGALGDVPPRDDRYYYDLIVDQFERLAKIWKKSQPRLRLEDGIEIMENPSMVESRMNIQKEIEAKMKRHTTRRHSRYDRRLNIVRFMIRAAGDDRPIWEWLQKLLEWLGTTGMSSEDTDIGVNREYRVKIMLWRREMDGYLDLIDKQRAHDAGYSQAGSNPIRRLRYLPTPPSKREAPKGLPEALYDEQWLASADADYREIDLSVSNEKFRWLIFHSEQME